MKVDLISIKKIVKSKEFLEDNVDNVIGWRSSQNDWCRMIADRTNIRRNIGHPNITRCIYDFSINQVCIVYIMNPMFNQFLYFYMYYNLLFINIYRYQLKLILFIIIIYYIKFIYSIPKLFYLFVVNGLERCSSWFDSNKQLLIQKRHDGWRLRQL
jgi:hypothetical protein